MAKNKHSFGQQPLHIPTGATVIHPSEQVFFYGGARRPNSIAWAAGNLFIGTTLFGWGGVLFLW